MNQKNKGTSIWISKEVKKRLATFGKKGDSYEDIIVKLMDEKDGMGYETVVFEKK